MTSMFPRSMVSILLVTLTDLIRTIDCSNEKGRISRVDLNAGPEFMVKSPAKERKPKRPKTAVHRPKKSKM